MVLRLIKNKKATIYCERIEKENDDTKFIVKTDKFEKEFVIRMPGLFNVENALAAISVAYALEIDEKYMYLGLKNAKTSGRMEFLYESYCYYGV